jgi:hypothetical protein
MTKQVLHIQRNPAVTANLPDPGITAVQQQIKSLLPGPVTAAQVVAALTPHHQSVTASGALVWYETRYDPVTGYWEIICHDESKVTVTDSQVERPIVVDIDDQMTV